jgi:drug/metabolite transporter (DMT)-like permease
MKQQFISLFQSPTGDRPIIAVILLLFGVFILALQDVTVKLIAPETSFWQFQTLRSVSNGLFIASLAFFSGGLSILAPKNWRPVYLRASMLTICMFCFFAGSPLLTVAQMAAGLYTYPLFVSLLAGPVLGENVGPWRIAALVTGTIGAGLILDPFDANFSPVQLLPVAAGFFYACNILILRHACRYESALSLVMAVAVLFAVSGLLGIGLLTIFSLPSELTIQMPFVFIGWPELTMVVFGFAIFCSMLNLSGNICLARAYQTADSSWLAPIDFTYLLFATFWGRVFFDTWPSQKAIIGMILIAIAGMVITWREHQ